MLETFIKSNFKKAIKLQDTYGHDAKIVNAVKLQTLDTQIVKTWMGRYNLFQGINTETRNKVADAFIHFTKSRNDKGYQIILEEDFKELHTTFYEIENRKWLSATSKLLWCINPNKIIIYDSFVERVISVLQCLDDDLAKHPRIGNSPNIKNDPKGELMTKHYINFQNIVNTLLAKNKSLIDELKKVNDVGQKYDVRIFDKLLWMMGDLNSSFSLDDIKCELQIK